MPHGPSSVDDRKASSPLSAAARRASRAGPKPPDAASFTFTASHAPASAAERTSSAVATDSSATIRERTERLTSDISSSVRHGCSTSWRSHGSSARMASTASSIDHAPFASTRRAGHGPIASRTAATRSTSSGSPTLTLKQAKPSCTPSRARAATSSGGPAGRVRFTAIRSAPGSPIGRPARRHSRSSRASSSADRAWGGPSVDPFARASATSSSDTPS